MAGGSLVRLEHLCDSVVDAVLDPDGPLTLRGQVLEVAPQLRRTHDPGVEQTLAGPLLDIQAVDMLRQGSAILPLRRR
jgi:hypothetical protein